MSRPSTRHGNTRKHIVAISGVSATLAARTGMCVSTQMHCLALCAPQVCDIKVESISVRIVCRWVDRRHNWLQAAQDSYLDGALQVTAGNRPVRGGSAASMGPRGAMHKLCKGGHSLASRRSCASSTSARIPHTNVRRLDLSCDFSCIHAEASSTGRLRSSCARAAADVGRDSARGMEAGNNRR